MLAKIFRVFFSFILTFCSLPIMAQDHTGWLNESNADFQTIALILVIVVAVMVLMLSIYLLYTVRLILRLELEKNEDKQKINITSKQNTWATFSQKMTKLVPIEQEENILMDHSYDGIKELDNHLPPWWTGLFYFTIVFGIAYLLVYHIIKPDWAPLQDQAYTMEMKSFEEQRAQMANFIDENNVKLTVLSEDIQNGKQLFVSNCASCHNQDGGGNIGPNLTDNYWIHGNEVQDVFKVIKYGVTGKMIPWDGTLSGKEIQDIANFVLQELVGTTPLDPKAPEGELVIPSKTDTTIVKNNLQANLK